MGLILALVGIVVIAVTAGVVVANHNKKNNNLSSSNSGTTSQGPSTVSQTNPNDPSTFVKNPDYHQSFYGIAYTPVGSQLPDCGNTLGGLYRLSLTSEGCLLMTLFGEQRASLRMFRFASSNYYFWNYPTE